jgi:hypothetical protein
VQVEAVLLARVPRLALACNKTYCKMSLQSIHKNIYV